jgi:hypothetical protein
MAKKILKPVRFSVRITQKEKEALLAVGKSEQLNEGETLRFAIRFTAQAYGLWPVADCPDCSCSTTDYIGGQNLRCENCGTHFCKSK